MEEKIILENKNLIYSISNYFSNYKSKEDLFQVGCIGLIKAYNNYDSSKGVKFSTYAYSYILGEMKRYVREDSGIKVSREVSSLSSKIDRVSNLLSQKLMRKPTLEEISSYLGIPINIVEEIETSKVTIKSIDECVGGTSLELHEVIPDKRKDINTLLFLREEISKLNDIERKIIHERFDKDYTQSETAKKLGISQVQVSRNEQKILRKLKDKIAV